tara:strand:- start:2766 stop:3896 length:1131 start_codon:yes stop_codon:yes gene_type:complete
VILQTLDIKDNCTGIFHNDEFLFDDFQKLLDQYSLAWKHSPMLDDEKYKYLYLLVKEEDLSSYCHDPELFITYKKKLEAHQKAAISAKVSLQDTCFFDLLPEHQLLKWFRVRAVAMDNLQKTVSFQKDYDILHKAHVLTETIARQDMNFEGKAGRVLYNIFGSATGRLTTKRGSVPVLTLKKEQRDLIRPQNDAFVELDLNAAEVRTLIALSGREQPQEDIHEWVVKNVFDGEMERSKAKIELFAWLYNPSNSKSRFDQIFSRQIFRDFFAPEDKVLTTPFGRRLAVEERKAQNYLLQSTTSDIVIQNAYKIMKMLKGKKSKIAFTLHDSIIIDMSKKDAIMLRDIKEQFEETPWGPFKSTCKIGKTFGHLKDLVI